MNLTITTENNIFQQQTKQKRREKKIEINAIILQFNFNLKGMQHSCVLHKYSLNMSLFVSIQENTQIDIRIICF